MHGLQKHENLALLREKIARIENRPPLAPGASCPSLAENRQRLAMPAGLLHEVFANDMRDAGTSLAFALDQARALLTPQRPAILYFQLLHEAQEAGFPYAPALAPFGIDPAALILCRVKTLPDLLWALEEALACPPVAAAIVDVEGDPKILDFTMGRRLSLRARAGNCSVFMLRYGRFRLASAASLRWHISPAPSAPDPFDDKAPGTARLRLRLEKGHQGEAFAGLDTGWLMEWTKNGFERIEHGHQYRPGLEPATPFPRPQPAALGNRLLETA